MPPVWENLKFRETGTPEDRELGGKGWVYFAVVCTHSKTQWLRTMEKTVFTNTV